MQISEADLARMRDQLLFDGRDAARKLSRFWVLLVLAAIIASAGVVADSTATVIGAMIVAPLMTPILGIVLSVVTGDSVNLARSLLLVAAGAVLVIAIGWLLGKVVPIPVVAADNSQVAGRVYPRLIDLIAALATGAVGSFALVRSDVSDTLPGVAIAISLVPPLAVVGLTLESDAPHQAVGALLLFLTNVLAILLSGLVVMALYHVRATTLREPMRRRLDSRLATLVVVGAVVAIAVPLAATSRQLTSEELQKADVDAVAQAWATDRGWEVILVDSTEDGILVRAIGPLPTPEPASFRAALDDEGLDEVDVRLELLLAESADLPGN
jgi:uncharacterized hydrophobic protein (TIGR00271 family)